LVSNESAKQKRGDSRPWWENLYVLGIGWSIAVGVFGYGVSVESKEIKVLGAVLFAFPALGSRYIVLNLLFERLPRWFRTDAGWNGEYRAFDNMRIRVIEGEGDCPSFVVLEDVWKMFNWPSKDMDIGMLRRKFGKSLRQSDDSRVKGKWVLEDKALVQYVSSLAHDKDIGSTANRFNLWLQRSVFRPIDNGRTLATGKTYTFTSNLHVQQSVDVTHESFKVTIKPPKE
jgi:hypothetical protein